MTKHFKLRLFALLALLAASTPGMAQNNPMLPPAMAPETRPSSAEVSSAVQRLSSRQAEDRQAAADALRRMGASAVSARSALLAAAGDTSPAVGVAAAEAWAATFARGPEGVAGLLAGLKDERELVRVAAAGRLAIIGDKDAKQIVPALIGLLADKQPAVRAKAASAIGLLAEAAPDEATRAVEPLAKMLSGTPDPQAWEERFDAARALLRIGPAARPALPAISAAMRSKDAIPFLRDRLVPLLPRVATGADLQTLLTALVADPDRDVSVAAAKTLADLSNPVAAPATRPM